MAYVKTKPKPRKCTLQREIKNQSKFKKKSIWKYEILYFILYWVSIFCFSVSGCKWLQLQQKDMSKYWPRFLTASLARNCLSPVVRWLERKKGKGLERFKAWSAGVLQARGVVSQDPHRRQRGKGRKCCSTGTKRQEPGNAARLRGQIQDADTETVGGFSKMET